MSQAIHDQLLKKKYIYTGYAENKTTHNYTQILLFALFF